MMSLTFGLLTEMSGTGPLGPLVLFVLFCVVFEYFYFLNLLLQRKPHEFAENLCFFFCLFPLCWNSDSKNSFVTCLEVGDLCCHSLEMSSP